MPPDLTIAIFSIFCYFAGMVGPPWARSNPREGIRPLVPVWLCIFVLLCGCAEMPADEGPPPPSFLVSQAEHPTFEIGVLIAGWHSGIVLPADEIGPLDPLLRESPRAKYVSFGWGNRRFYMAAHPGSGDAVAAPFRSSSALFVRGFATAAELSATDAQVHWVCANREELWRTTRYIEASLYLPDGKPVGLGPGPLPDSRFYASTGHYSGVHTCNTWTVAALQYAGFQARAGGVIFADQAARRISSLRACPAP